MVCALSVPTSCLCMLVLVTLNMTTCATLLLLFWITVVSSRALVEPLALSLGISVGGHRPNRISVCLNKTVLE